MTADAYLTGLRELEQDATRGPWVADRNSVRTEWVEGPDQALAGYPVSIANLCLTTGNFESEQQNARFIAAARDALPRLLAALGSVLALTRSSDGDDLYPSTGLTVGDLRDALSAGLAADVPAPTSARAAIFRLGRRVRELDAALTRVLALDGIPEAERAAILTTLDGEGG